MVSWHWHVFVWTCELIPRMALRHLSFFFRYHPHISRSIGTIHTSLDRSVPSTNLSIDRVPSTHLSIDRVPSTHLSIDRIPSTPWRTSTSTKTPPYESRSESRAVVGWTIIMWQVHVSRWQYQVHIIHLIGRNTMRYRILSYGRFDSMIWYPEMSSMAWSGGE